MLKTLKAAAVLLATVGLVSPQAVFAADAPVNAVPNVKLTSGVMNGRVVNPAGQPVQTAIVIAQNGQEVARTATDVNGLYRVAGLNTGVYTLSTESGSANVRTWSNAAPPTAVDSLVVTDGQIVRGNSCDDGCCSTGCRTACIGGGLFIAAVATAIIIESTDNGNIPASP